MLTKILRYSSLALLALCLGTATVTCSSLKQTWIFDSTETAMATDNNTINYFSNPNLQVLYSAVYSHPPPSSWNVLWWLKYDNWNANTLATHTPNGFNSDCPSGNAAACLSGIEANTTSGSGTVQYVGYDTEPWNLTPSWEWSNTATQCNTPNTCTMAGTWASGTSYALNAIVQCAQGSGSACSAADGNMYISLENGNSGNDPSNSATACSGGPCWTKMMLSYSTLEASINAFTARAHAEGFKTACMPASSLFRSSMNSGFITGSTDWDTFIASGVLQATAAGCDVYEFQIQGSQYDLQDPPPGRETYANIVYRWANTVYGANANAIVIAGLSTYNFTLAQPATPAQICAAALQDPQSVNGYWLNLVQNQTTVFSGAMQCLNGALPPTPGPTASPTPTPTPGVLTATPNPLPTFVAFGATGAQALVLNEPFYTGSLSLAGCTGVLTIAPSTGTGPTLLSTLTPVANGSCNLTGTDSHGGSVTVPAVVATPTPAVAPDVIANGHDSGDMACGGGNNSISFGTTAPVGDLMLMYVRVSAQTQPVIPPTGFTVLDTQVNQAETFYEYYKIAVGKDGTNFPYNPICSGRIDYHTLIVENENSFTPFDDHEINFQALKNTTGPFSSSTATATQANDLPIINLEGQCCDPISVASTVPSGLTNWGESGQFVNYLFTDTPVAASGTYGPDSMTLASNNGTFAWQIQVVDLINPAAAGPTPPPSPTPAPFAYMGAGVTPFANSGAIQEANTQSLESSLGRKLGTNLHFFFFGNLGPTPPPGHTNQGYLTQAQMSQDPSFVGTNGVGGDCNTTRIPVLSWRVGDNFTTIAGSNATDNAIIDAAATGLNWLRDTCGKSTVFLRWAYEYNLDRDGSGTNKNYTGMFTLNCASITTCTPTQTASQQSEFIAAQEFVYNRLLADGVTNTIPVIVSSNWNGGNQLLGFIPPSSAGFTWVGFDAYDNNCQGYAATTKNAYNALSTLGLPIGIFEFGEGNGQSGICSQKQAITDATNAMAPGPNQTQPALQMFEYFDAPGNPGHLNWTLDSGGVTALTTMGCLTYFGGCSTAPGPLTVVPSSLTFTSTSAPTQTFAVSETNYSGTIGVAGCSGIATASPNSFTNNPNTATTVTVTPIGVGSCVFTVTDNHGGSQPVAVTVMNSTNADVYQGCSMYQAGDAYHTNATTLTPYTNSANIISYMKNNGVTGGLTVSLANPGALETMNIATSQTTTYQPNGNGGVHWKYDFNAWRVPWQTGFVIENGGVGDAHGLVINLGNCQETEMYQTLFNSNGLAAFSGWEWKLDGSLPFYGTNNNGPADPTNVPPRGQAPPNGTSNPSANAGGISILAGAIRDTDIQQGAINHALIFSPLQGVIACDIPSNPNPAIVWPDTSSGNGSGCSSSPNAPAYGQWFRLHASFTTSCITGGTCPQFAMVVTALKIYGVIIGDAGSENTPELYALVSANKPSGILHGSDLSNVSSIHITDFDVMTPGAHP